VKFQEGNHQILRVSGRKSPSVLEFQGGNHQIPGVSGRKSPSVLEFQGGNHQVLRVSGRKSPSVSDLEFQEGNHQIFRVFEFYRHTYIRTYDFPCPANNPPKFLLYIQPITLISN